MVMQKKSKFYHQVMKQSKIENRKFMQVNYLKMLPNLKIIDLRNNCIVEMIGFQQCYNLEELYLCENFITRIKRIKHLNKLKMIDLRDNHIINLNADLHNLPQSVVQLKARFNLINYLNNIFKLDNKFEVIWLDQNRFVRGAKSYFKRIFWMKGLVVADLWL